MAILGAKRQGRRGVPTVDGGDMTVPRQEAATGDGWRDWRWRWRDWVAVDVAAGQAAKPMEDRGGATTGDRRGRWRRIEARWRSGGWPVRSVEERAGRHAQWRWRCGGWPTHAVEERASQRAQWRWRSGGWPVRGLAGTRSGGGGAGAGRRAQWRWRSGGWSARGGGGDAQSGGRAGWRWRSGGAVEERAGGGRGGGAGWRRRAVEERGPAARA